MLISFLFACQSSLSVDSTVEDTLSSTSTATEITIQEELRDITPASQWPVDFPASQDLALMFGIQDEAIIEASTLTPYGDVFLPYRWLNAVSNAYEETDVLDALEVENYYDDWRLVSMRIVPCSPMGIATTQAPAELCWPMVRLVWQPVMLDFRLSWGMEVSAYADDRAIHALYPLQARDLEGNAYESQLRKDLINHLKAGRRVEDIPEEILEEFAKQRDLTATWLLHESLSLRSSELGPGSWTELAERSEWYDSTEEQDLLQKKLIQFLGETAHPDQLAELTSFSLPEGREPAHLDIWVFVAFEGKYGNIFPVDLQVMDQTTGEQLINMGKSQSVSMVSEDPTVEESIEAGNKQLEQQVIADTDDLSGVAQDIADPNLFLVPNTSCASCHKLNDLRFDFHNLSHLEDRSVTISPRVRNDVLFDQAWTRELRNR